MESEREREIDLAKGVRNTRTRRYIKCKSDPQLQQKIKVSSTANPKSVPVVPEGRGG